MPRAFGGRLTLAAAQAHVVELRVEELLQPDPRLGFVGVARVVLQTVCKHQLYVAHKLRCRLVFIVVDPLPDGAEGDGFLDDVVIIWDLRA